ncbi:MAG TPA: DUF748 domain-containing protein [Candidatus Omnitrophota bacterium]|nr:DUF748 domain-containing protein [Candidatus Omnitrophota bacterium]HRZ14376.1 DUF748 domain-containing protein [Candidatus Omnitrophota bacterium]
MRKRTIASIVLLLLLTGSFFFLGKASRFLLIRKLEVLTRQKISLQSVSYRFPLSFRLNNLAIGDGFRVQQLYVEPVFSSLFKGNPYFTRVEALKPVVLIKRLPVSQQQRQGLRLSIVPAHHIVIRDGEIELSDRAVAAREVKFQVKRIDAVITGLRQSLSPGIIRYAINAQVCWPETEPGSLKIDGWLDQQAKNIRARVAFRGIDGIFFYPYYQSKIDLAKARFKEAVFDFTGDISGADNRVAADCRLELVRHSFLPLAPGEEQGKPEKTARLLLDIFRNLDNGRILLDFTLHSSLDNPRIDLKPLQSALEDKINRGIKIETVQVEDAVILPQKIIKGTVKKVSELSQSVVGNAVDWGNQLKSAIIDTFIKVKPVDAPRSNREGE